jgi:hypothetical protein
MSRALGRELSAFGLEGLCGAVRNISDLGRFDNLSSATCVRWKDEGGVGGEYDEAADDRDSSSSLQKDISSPATERWRFVVEAVGLGYVCAGMYREMTES